MSSTATGATGLMILLGVRFDDAAPLIAAGPLHTTLPAIAMFDVVLTRMSGL